MNKEIYSVSWAHRSYPRPFFPIKKYFIEKFFYTSTKQYKDILAQEILKKTSVRVKIIAKIKAPYQKIPLEITR